MKQTTLLAMTAAMATLAVSSCTSVPMTYSLRALFSFNQRQPAFNPADVNSADWGSSGNMPLPLAGSDIKTVCGHAHGESKGFSLLGIFPFTAPTEHEALKNMYKDARARGIAPEGEARQFANKSIERSSTYYILWSTPKITARGDLVQYMYPSDKYQYIFGKDKEDKDNSKKKD